MGEHQNLDPTASADLARAYMDAFQRQDAAAMCALLTDDFALEVPFSNSGTNDPADCHAWRGKENFRVNYAEFFPKMLPVQKFTDLVIRPTADGEVVYAEGNGDMTLANGRPYKNRYVFKFDIRGDKICHMLEICNPVTAAIAFGQPLPATS